VHRKNSGGTPFKSSKLNPSGFSLLIYLAEGGGGGRGRAWRGGRARGPSQFCRMRFGHAMSDSEGRGDTGSH
jgi:hypothetical protein